jgi:hypothetical protein
VSRHVRDDLWPVFAAGALTVASFGGVLVAMREAGSWPSADARSDRHAAPERVTIVVPRPAPFVAAPPVSRAVSSGALPPPVPRLGNSTRFAGPDSSPVQPAPTATTRDPEERSSWPSPYSSSPRLVPLRQRGAPWYSLPRRRAPLAPPEALSAAERDSVLHALGAEVPELAAQRIQTQGERDAASKEAMLKIHLSGRNLLVPPDNTGGMITASIPLPLFSAGPSRARRRRESQVQDENRARLERLKHRADSLKRARGDSLPPT